jgi:hypothetical protein
MLCWLSLTEKSSLILQGLLFWFASSVFDLLSRAVLFPEVASQATRASTLQKCAHGISSKQSLVEVEQNCLVTSLSEIIQLVRIQLGCQRVRDVFRVLFSRQRFVFVV